MKIDKQKAQFIRKYFLTGILVVVPSWATLTIMHYIFTDLDQRLGNIFDKLLPGASLIPGMGLFLAFIATCGLGFIASNVIVNRLIDYWDTLLHRIPFINKVYKSFQQITHVIFARKDSIFHKVVLLEYPRKGIHSVGFVTADTEGELKKYLTGDYYNIFVPTTPNPTSGYMVVVHRSEVTELTMSVEDAMKLVISAGSVSPEFAKKNGRPSSNHLAHLEDGD